MSSTVKPPGKADDLLQKTETSKHAHERQQNAQGGTPLTAAEVMAHPEYPYIYWDLPADKQDRLEVAAGRGGPLNIAYEIHGYGPRKLVWLMGLGGLMNNWQRQTKYFGHENADKYTCLIIDNRGIGKSDKPLLRYTTSEMAKDVIEVLDHIGWTEDRSLHLVGISMGGMISQELGMLIPERICSLNLISTAPRIVRTLPFWENLKNRAYMLIPKSLDAQIAKVKEDCYSPQWLSQPDELEHTVQKFPTNGDRFAAGELKKRTTPGNMTSASFICQLIAAGWHHKSAKDLKQIGDKVGRERILVFHGTGDHMIDFMHAEMLLKELGGEDEGITKSFHEGMGHVGPIEIRHEFNNLIVDRVETTERLSGR